MLEREVKVLEGELKVKDFKLNSLLDLTNAISLHEDISTITRIFEFILKVFLLRILVYFLLKIVL